MAENKTDFIRDPEVIRKEMEEISEILRKNKGFNIGSNMFSVDKDANGYVLTLRSVIDNNKHGPAGWKYGTYYLDGYPKTGFYTMKEGKFVFLPTKNEIDKSKEVEYKTVQDFKAAIEAENPNLVGKISMTTGFGAEGIIQIEDAVDGIDLPTTDLYYDQQKGCIVSSINPGIEFRVEFVSSAERSVDNVGNGATPMSSDVSSSLNSAAIRDVDSRQESTGKGVSPMEYGVSIIDFAQMKEVFEGQYRFGDDNNVVSDEKDRTGDVLKEAKTSSVPDPRKTEAIMRVNEIWLNAYHMYNEGVGQEASKNETAFTGTITAVIFDGVIDGLKKGGYDLKMSDLPKMLFNNKNIGLKNSNILKSVLVFISHPEIAPMFELQMDIGPEAVVQKVEELEEDFLRQEANDLVDSLEEGMELLPSWMKNKP